MVLWNIVLQESCEQRMYRDVNDQGMFKSCQYEKVFIQTLILEYHVQFKVFFIR